MDSKYVAMALVVIIVLASAIGYLAYNGTFSSKTTPPTTLRVFIASSLDYVVANMTKAFDKANNCNIIVNSASSSTLYTQITQGSPCDVFMSADIKWTKELNSSKLLYNNYYTNLTTNSLCIILAQGNSKGITSLADLVKPEVRLVVAASSVPVGSYTNTTLWKIDSTWGNASDTAVYNPAFVNYNATFAKNVVSYETTDENIVGDVSLNLGTADAGIVFVSDWAYGNMTGAQVQFLPIPSSVNTSGTYGIAVPSETTQSALAQKFMNYWLSDQGQMLLKEYGFDLKSAY
ncbi:MAG: molybdate ABC transporter substrate-binding protein [Candidatus Bathyarchaeia archaeon]|jgi:molybdate transport system substrate-binding protein